MYVKKISLELTEKDYISLSVALSRAFEHYSDICNDPLYCSADAPLASHYSGRLESLKRLQHMIDDSGEWVNDESD